MFIIGLSIAFFVSVLINIFQWNDKIDTKADYSRADESDYKMWMRELERKHKLNDYDATYISRAIVMRMIYNPDTSHFLTAEAVTKEAIAELQRSKREQ